MTDTPHKKQTRLDSYFKTIKLFWGTLYSDGGKTIYSLQEFESDKPQWINIEHIFPMAWVVNKFNCRDREECRRNKEFSFIESDMHNLFPSRKDLNTLRANHRFGSIKGELRAFGTYNFKVDEKKRIVEPAPASQGEVARAMFHMSQTYGLKIFEKQAKTLAYWNRIDQPSKEEKRRNDLIEDIQGTRNYFIDNPKTIEKLYQK